MALSVCSIGLDDTVCIGDTDYKRLVSFTQAD
ncbi:predicted protein [Sclerotinia sclerotiorum 1980 UF-70]|uniref:Uncharacterized protein n=1 Tax=Sclerotinia sclerotiorum (strain ATCC 18683 / 1980 / Ss-1) TaxID=665079 RepID=A7EFE4_SCLS1|nr:predicted protein [Sclerotinia sclerotiorum 1980 UF-70]EDO01560.1 predicted protein [Sclerotinia sclerotiorum 1980 UF-70]